VPTPPAIGSSSSNFFFFFPCVLSTGRKELRRQKIHCLEH
jgi:hypothetical protein